MVFNMRINKSISSRIGVNQPRILHGTQRPFKFSEQKKIIFDLGFDHYRTRTWRKWRALQKKLRQGDRKFSQMPIRECPSFYLSAVLQIMRAWNPGKIVIDSRIHLQREMTWFIHSVGWMIQRLQPRQKQTKMMTFWYH